MAATRTATDMVSLDIEGKADKVAGMAAKATGAAANGGVMAGMSTAAIAGVNVEGSLHDAQRAVLWSRLASRVLWPLAEFDCADEHALYQGARAIAWRLAMVVSEPSPSLV